MFKYLIMVLILCFALFSVFHSTAASDVGKCIRACIKMLHKLTKLRYNAIVHMQVHAQQYSSFVLLGQCAKFICRQGSHSVSHLVVSIMAGVLEALNVN